VINQKLKSNDEVFILWTKQNGFVEFEARFQSYVKGKIVQRTPLFSSSSGDVTGEECFWILKTRIKHPSEITIYQKMLFPLQSHFQKLAKRTKQKFHPKIKVREFEKMVQENNDQHERFVARYGFDPLDDSWIEQHLAANELEKNWFEFTRKNRIVVLDDQNIKNFNKQYGKDINVEQGNQLSKKRHRYVLGSYSSRMRGINDVEQWKKESVEFETHFNEVENRMRNWTLSRNGRYPYVTVKLPVRFWHGAMLNQCIERIPEVFTAPDCGFIKSGVALQVFGYDPEDKWIDLDFAEDIRHRLLGQKKRPEKAAYSIAVLPDEVGSHLEWEGA